MARIEYDPNRRVVKMVPVPEHLYDFFNIRGYYFSHELLTRYFLSLKTKPFVILTGISGTGKTKIAQVFAEYMCQDDVDRARRIVFLPVRPDWMDSRGLLGYYNLLDEKYHVTPLLRLLIEAANHPDKPYFVILDEMNLAKVEQYFSDFLSIMESRTTENYQGEPLVIHGFEVTWAPDGTSIPAKLHIPPNVFFTGTVNVDESTYMFSPKVLDRANVIEFNEVDLTGYGEGITATNGLALTEPDVRSALLPTDNDAFCAKEDYVKFLGIVSSKDHPIVSLQNILAKYNLHFGYRVVNEMSRFVCLSHKLLQKFDLDDVMDVQMLQKVLPKFHGTQAKLDEPLRALFSFCYDSDVTSTDEKLSVAELFDNKARFPRSAQKLARMIRNLRTQGYVSFIE